MDPKLFEKARKYSTSRYLALIAGFTALYLVYGYASGVALQHTIFELDLFFLISALFTILASLTGRRWSATVLATINALLLLGDPNAPLAIGLSLIPNGLVFDLVLRWGDHRVERPTRRQFVIAGALGNLAMAVAGLIIAIAVGAPGTSGVLLITSVAIAVIGNPIVGALGAIFGTIVVERFGAAREIPRWSGSRALTGVFPGLHSDQWDTLLPSGNLPG